MTPFSIRLSVSAAIALAVVGVSGRVPLPAQRTREPSYVGAFTDLDFYILAIAADFRAERQRRGQLPTAELEAAAQAALAVHRIGVVVVDSGWLFEPGVWRDYPDDQYAGTEDIPPLHPAPVFDVAYDASHFSRWPLFLSSHRDGWGRATPAWKYYDGLRRSLAWQFRAKVLVPPDSAFRGWRTRNYMDGRNGVYRWDYRTHRGRGYGPFQLSGTLLYGWWAFLDDSVVSAAFADMATRFPYGSAESTAYAGTGEHQPRLNDGRGQLEVLLASRLRDGKADLLAPKVGRVADSLWRRYGPALLARPIWRGPEAESAQYDLMVPLHYAAWTRDQAWMEQFTEHFHRFVLANWPTSDTSILQRLHYMYFATRYMSLMAESGQWKSVPPGLEAKIFSEWDSLWSGYSRPISSTAWGEPPFSGYRQYLQWKIDRWGAK